MKKNYHDESWVNENVWEKYGPNDEIGQIQDLTPADVLKAISLVKKGKIYDLETERFKGMPVWAGHTGFELLSYASPNGRQNMKSSNIDSSVNWYKEGEWLDIGTNAPEYHMGLNTEMLVTSMHIGTHMDALCHFSTGEDNHWYNGFSAKEYETNFGPTKCDITSTPPMVMRGILLDMAGFKGVESLPNNYIVSAEDCEACAKWEGIELQKGDAVFVRLGDNWPHNACGDAGLGISAARYLVEECGALLVGDDMACIDGFHADGSTSVPQHPQPVHHYLLIQQGVHILEYVQLDELAKDKAYEFCFICAVSKVRGATGMFVRPIAIV